MARLRFEFGSGADRLKCAYTLPVTHLSIVQRYKKKMIYANLCVRNFKKTDILAEMGGSEWGDGSKFCENLSGMSVQTPDSGFGTRFAHDKVRLET